MNLKYVCRNDGYIIDRRLNNTDNLTDKTFTTRGSMTLTEVVPEDDSVKKDIIEYAFDNMKNNILDEFKKKYFLKDDELITYFFEGKVNPNNEMMYATLGSEEIPVRETDFNLDFEVEVKITPKNFFKVQYDNLRYKNIGA